MAQGVVWPELTDHCRNWPLAANPPSDEPALPGSKRGVPFRLQRSCSAGLLEPVLAGQLVGDSIERPDSASSVQQTEHQTTVVSWSQCRRL